MTRSPVKKILLPAVLVSIGIFALMMTMFSALRSPEPPPRQRLQDLDEPTEEWILPAERDNHRIRQVGMAFILSVSAGMVAVEGLRRWYAFHESGQIKVRQLGLEDFLLEEHAQSEEED
jgi:hypothetical protein